MKTMYVYVLDTLADWEIGHVTAEMNSRRYFKKDAPSVSVKTVSVSKEPVKTMGGMNIIPDCVIDDIAEDETSMLVLPGADTWSDPKHAAVITKARALLECGGAVFAICGATVALAHVGLLDTRSHTSNGAGFLDMFCPSYKGQQFYVESPSTTDGNLITAGCTGAILWAKQIIKYADVFKPDTLEAWYNYFSTGSMDNFFALMKTLS